MWWEQIIVWFIVFDEKNSGMKHVMYLVPSFSREELLRLLL